MLDQDHGRGTGRRRALDAARALFSDRGYEATSIQEVLNTSGLSRGALYHHFANKAELFTAVLEDVEAEILTDLAARAARAGSYREAVRTGALGFLEMTMDPAVRSIVLINAPAALGWARWREIDSRYAFGALRSGLQGAVDAGELNLDEDLIETSAHILLAGLMEMGLLVAQSEDPETAHDRASRSINRLLDGIWGHAK